MEVQVRDPKTEWLGEVRPGTDDETIVREVFVEDVYRLNQGILREGDLVIDVGAHVGTFSIRAAAYGATVIAVEPNPESAAQLMVNAASAGQLERITLNLAGVAATGGWKLRSVGSDGSAFTILDGGGSPSVTLDELIGGRTVRLIKVDIEGSEFQIFADRPNLHAVEHIAMEWHAAPMLNGRDPGGTVGALVEALLSTHHVEVFGDPAQGGALYATLYGLEPRLELPVT